MIRTRPCTRPCTVHTVVSKACTRPPERTGYTAVHGPCTYTQVCLRLWPMNTALFTARVHGRVRTLYTAMHGPCTRPCTGRVHGREQPCTRSTAVFTVHIYGGHGRERRRTLSVNTPVYRVHSRTRPCTCHGRTMYMARARSCTQSVHGPGNVTCTLDGRPCKRSCTCTRPCLLPMYTAVHGDVQTVYTAVHGPCIHGPSMTRTRPCIRPCLRPCKRSFMACTDCVHLDTMHTRHRKS